MAMAKHDITGDSILHFNRHTGGLSIFDLQVSGGYEVLVDDRLAGIHIGEPKPVRLINVNRFLDGTLSLPELHWRIGGDPAAPPAAKNLNAEWTLEGGNTAYISSLAAPAEQPVTAVFHCPLQGPNIAVVAGTVYTFEMLIGLHRAEGEVRLVFLDRHGAEVETIATPVLKSFWGGTRPELYGRNVGIARAPNGAATC